MPSSFSARTSSAPDTSRWSLGRWPSSHSLVLGTLEWLRTLALLAGERRAAGAPYLRLTLILAGIALATALSRLAFRSRAVTEHFRL